ncbi:DNA-directed RNA polymerase I subunit RPA12 [Tribolium castaneum]|uniref:DNA-directed RNA polymerase subunit n=1 Tax=Tribolium castaneum TaxID=7070 RepID=D6WBZ4_TRICA|nr:PREDICTED: DNA-directed RNA polymerase I subunit RPA12 [Tribolium castaneum]EEZ99110.1 DNA-directed RNA polymerase I subunit RPA12-like Protein [Tribolium castaneum]|eukprot:XP_967369.1 PREDICTED: DNA-directed RNA polymerase I subunit RPA12 [Tribolium castaneum]
MSTGPNFESIEGFCPDCGSILPPLKQTGGVKCYACERNFPSDVFRGTKASYVIHFNSRDYKTHSMNKQNNKKDEEEDDGPVVDRKCAKCGHDKMTYATVQLRSADEGQTVFYTCTKCKFKESENS